MVRASASCGGRRTALIGGVAVVLALSLLVGTGRAGARPARSSWCGDSIWWRHAREHAGDQVRIRGPVAEVKMAPGSRGRTIFVSVGNAYPNPNRFTAVVHNDGADNDMPVPWPDDAGYLVGKRQCFDGRVYLVRGVPYMRITHFDFVDGTFVE